MSAKSFAHFGVVGLTDDSKSILLGMHDLGFVGCVYDFDHDKVTVFLENEAKDTKIFGAASLEEMMNSLTIKRCVVMFVEDFNGVELTIDDFIDIQMLPHMSYQDFIINASSSGRGDSEQRVTDLLGKGIRYVGVKNKVSVDLLQGICITFENHDVWNNYHSETQPSLYKRTQKATPEFEKKTCCIWGMPDQKQSYIELTINNMSKQNERLFDEADRFLSMVAELKDKQKHVVFGEWSKGDLKSYWCQSSMKSVSGVPPLNKDQKKLVDYLEKALLACQVIVYARGFASIKELAELHQWDINYAELKPAWPKDYSYKCTFYRKIRAAFTKNPQLRNLLLDEDFAKIVNEGLPGIKEVVTRGSELLNIMKTLTGRDLYFSVKEFSCILEYYQDFMADKPLCARLFNAQNGKKGAKEKLDLSPLYKYQYQLREQQSLIEKIEKAVKEANEESEDNDHDNSWASMFKNNRSSIKKKVKNLHEDKLQPYYEACIKHMEMDEKVTPLHMNALSNKINHVKEISKIFLSEKRKQWDYLGESSEDSLDLSDDFD